MEKQLLSWEQREEELNQKWHAAGEEVTQTREVLEKIQQENKELIKERSLIHDSSAFLLFLLCVLFCFYLFTSTL